MADLTSKFKKIEESYHHDAVETKNLINITQLEREDNERLVQLYRTQNEILDTQNR